MHQNDFYSLNLQPFLFLHPPPHLDNLVHKFYMLPSHCFQCWYTNNKHVDCILCTFIANESGRRWTWHYTGMNLHSPWPCHFDQYKAIPDQGFASLNLIYFFFPENRRPVSTIYINLLLAHLLLQ